MSMSCAEAGRRGGRRTKALYGVEHFQKAGKRGGEAVAQDPKHMAEIGRRGGKATSENRKHMSEIGRKGGQAKAQNQKTEAENT